MLTAVYHCLFKQDSLENLENDWNKLARLHTRILYSDEGMKALQEKVTRGDFGICDRCKTPLIPVGRRNKPYIDHLYLVCVCCEKVRGELKNIDGAVYGTWTNPEEERQKWLSDLKKNCKKP